MIELKRCPTCSSDDVDAAFWTQKKNEEFSTGPGCMDCGTSAESVEIWNTRPTEDKLVEALEKIQQRGYACGSEIGLINTIHDINDIAYKALKEVKG